MLKTYIEKKIIAPVLQLLRQGISPEKISLSIAWGIVIGIFPVVGTTTLLCTVVAIVLRLNLPIIQIANWLAYPLQLVLIAPFFFVGAYVFGSEPLTGNAQELIFLFQSDLVGAVILMKGIIVDAILVWICLAPVLIILLCRVLAPILKRIRIHRTCGMDSGGRVCIEGRNKKSDAGSIS